MSQPETEWKPLARGGGRARKRQASDAAESLEPQGRDFTAAACASRDYSGRDYGGRDQGPGDYSAAAVGASWSFRRTSSTAAAAAATGSSRRRGDPAISIDSLREESGEEDDWLDARRVVLGGHSGSESPALFAGPSAGRGSPARWQRQPDFGTHVIAGLVYSFSVPPCLPECECECIP